MKVRQDPLVCPGATVATRSRSLAFFGKREHQISPTITYAKVASKWTSRPAFPSNSSRQKSLTTSHAKVFSWMFQGRRSRFRAPGLIKITTTLIITNELPHKRFVFFTLELGLFDFTKVYIHTPKSTKNVYIFIKNSFF